MFPFRVLKKSNSKRLTWKNGLGYSDEIAIHPELAELKKGDFLWRISSARIEQASPFSIFPNHDRILVVLSGGGLKLTHSFIEGEEEEQVEIPLLSPYEFPGDITSRCELISGPIQDLSVFIRKGEVEAQVESISVTEGEDYAWRPSGRWNFIFIASGSFECANHTLSSGDTLSLEMNSPCTESIPVQARNGDGKIITISLNA